MISDHCGLKYPLWLQAMASFPSAKEDGRIKVVEFRPTLHDNADYVDLLRRSSVSDKQIKGFLLFLKKRYSVLYQINEVNVLLRARWF